jgi:DUF438 domain-containing protein
MEHALIMEGMPVENIQLLCDVHASVFKGSVREIHADDGMPVNHPVYLLKRENRLIRTLISEKVLPSLAEFTNNADLETSEALKASLQELQQIDKHYARKEYLIFPVMERNDITAPPQVMWGVDDEIRAKLKSVVSMLQMPVADMSSVKELTEEVTEQISEMIMKEEEIMLPMIADVFTEKDWESVSASSDDFGYMFAEQIEPWKAPEMTSGEAVDGSGVCDGERAEEVMDQSKHIVFDAGRLLPEEINAILNTLPLDMTFVGADDRVKYFTQGKERIFDRPITIIGREVKNCHPPKSVHVVEQIVADLRSGKKDHEDFWISLGDRFVHIRYFAVRSKDGGFLGTLEVTQDIKPLRELEGEKRLMS